MGELINKVFGQAPQPAASEQPGSLSFAPSSLWDIPGRVAAGITNTVKNLPGIYSLPDATKDLYDIIVGNPVRPESEEWLPGAHELNRRMMSSDENVREFFGVPRADPMMAGNVTDTLLEDVPSMLLAPELIPVKLASKASKVAKAADLVAGLATGLPTTRLAGKIGAGVTAATDAGLMKWMESRGWLDPSTAEPSVPGGETGPSQSASSPAGLLEQGNVDLHNRPRVKNADGSISTVRSMSFQDDQGREVLVPTVSDDGRIMSDKEAWQNYLKTGKHLGMFDTPEHATAYANSLHEQQAQEYAQPRLIDTVFANATEQPFMSPSNGVTDGSAVAPRKRSRLMEQVFADDLIEQDDGFSWKDKAWMGAGGLIALYAAKKLHSKSLLKMRAPSERFGLNAPEVSTSGVAAKLDEALADQDAPIIALHERAGDKAGANFVEMSRPGGSAQARLRSLAGTGKFAGSDVEIPRLTDDMSQYAKLSPDEQRLFAEGVRAGDKLTGHLNDPANYSLGNETLPELQAKVRDAVNDPGTVGKLTRNYQRIAQGLAKLRYDAGLITKEEYDLWTQQHYFYMPRFARDKQGFFRRAGNVLSNRGGHLKSPKDAKLAAGAVPDDVKLVDPHSAMEQYMYDTIREIDDNTIRRSSVKALQKTDPKGIRLGEKGDPETFDVWENGKSTTYYVKDPIIRRSLLFSPQQSGVILNGARALNELYTWNTTGPGAPLQALRAFSYDALGATGMAHPDMPYTPKIGGFDTGLIPVVGPALGVGQAAMGTASLLRANIRRTFGEIFRNMALTKGNPLGGMADELASRTSKAFENSTLDMMERYGAISTRLLHSDNVVHDFKTITRELAPAYGARAPNVARTYNVYHNILDSFQNGARAFHFMKYEKKAAKQFGRGTEDYHKRMLEVAKNTRQLTGDFGKRGASQVTTALRAGIPYWNPSIQTFKTLGQAFKRDPKKFSLWMTSMMTTFGTSAYMMMNESPEHAEYYLNEMPMSDRNRFMWIPKKSFDKDGNEKVYPPEQSWAIPLPPEMQVLNAMAVSFMETMFDTRNTGQPMGERAWEAIGDTLGSDKFQTQLGEAAMQALPLSIPVGMSQMMPFMGLQRPIGRFTADQIYTSPYDDGAISPTVQNIMSSFFGTSGAALMRAFDEGSMHVKGGQFDLTDTDNFFSAALDQLGEEASHYSPTIAPLWGHNRALRGGTYEGKVFKDKRNAIAKVTETLPFIDDYLTGVGGTGAGQAPSWSQKAPLSDMSEKNIHAYRMIAAVAREFNEFGQQINSLRDEISAINNRNDLSAHEKANMSTARLRQIAKIQRRLTKAYSAYIEEPLAELYGHKVTIEEIADLSQMSTRR